MSDKIELDPQLKATADEVNNVLMRDILPFFGTLIQSEGLPASLCHYTDFAGLHGILKTRCLWATYAKSLNDTSEQEYGQAVVNAYLRIKVSEKVRQDVGTSVINLRRNFVTCFCEDSRVLSMWTNYARLGGGFCLEFNGPHLLGSGCSFPPHPASLRFK